MSNLTVIIPKGSINLPVCQDFTKRTVIELEAMMTMFSSFGAGSTPEYRLAEAELHRRKVVTFREQVDCEEDEALWDETTHCLFATMFPEALS